MKASPVLAGNANLNFSTDVDHQRSKVEHHDDHVDQSGSKFSKPDLL